MPSRLRARIDQAERRLRALLHDVAQLAGQDQLAGAGGPGRLDEQDVAADRGPGEAGRDARNAGADRDLVLELARAEDLAHVVGLDAHALRGAFGDAHGDVAQTAPICRSRLRTPASRV